MSLPILSTLRRAVADPDIAIDLGTANTRLYARGRGLIADEPSVVKFPAGAARGPAAAGGVSIAPMRAGVVVDVDAAAALLAPLLRRARRLGLIGPRVLTCAPTDASDDERAALVQATYRAGAAAVTVAPEPLAAAIGAGLDITSPYAQMLVDIGDGVTDIAVIRSASLMRTAAVRTACGDLHSAVYRSVADSYGVSLYPAETERLTREVGARRIITDAVSFTVTGTDSQTGREKSISISGREVADAMRPGLSAILQAVSQAVRDLPNRMACEVIESGICLTGGGAHLPGLAQLIAAETALDVRPSADPLHAVINGACQMLGAAETTRLWAS